MSHKPIVVLLLMLGIAGEAERGSSCGIHAAESHDRVP
jgi:hypothetical protein